MLTPSQWLTSGYSIWSWGGGGSGGEGRSGARHQGGPAGGNQGRERGGCSIGERGGVDKVAVGGHAAGLLRVLHQHTAVLRELREDRAPAAHNSRISHHSMFFSSSSFFLLISLSTSFNPCGRVFSPSNCSKQQQSLTWRYFFVCFVFVHIFFSILYLFLAGIFCQQAPAVDNSIVSLDSI